MSQSFDTSETPHITVAHCEGDLAVTGADRRTVAVFGDDDEIKVERQGESLTVTATNDCDVHCPPGTSLTIKQVDGDLTIQGIEGPLAVESTHGDVTLRDVGPATLRQVSGDLELRGVQGDLHLESVSGDVKMRQVSGTVKIKSTHGDLVARDLAGGVEVGRVDGDVSLSTALASSASYRIVASGDISAKVDVGGGARVTLKGGEVHCRLPLKVTERKTDRIVGTVGDGSAELVLEAGGDVSASEHGEGWGWEGTEQWESAMESWTQQFEAQMADMQRKLEERLTNIPFVDSETVSRHAREAVERARRQAERSAERSRMRAERASRKHKSRGRGVRWSWSAPQPAQQGTAEPVSDAERMTILKMVADKKITADEASRLLAALEGES
jgi:hypothetical protein